MLLRKISLFILLLPTQLLANIAIENTPIPGGVAVIDFVTPHQNPKAYYNKIPLHTQQIKGNHWQVLFGIPLLTKPGIKTMNIVTDSTRKIKFKVGAHKYSQQYITLKGKNKKYVAVSKNKKHMDRITNERSALTTARNVFSAQLLTSGAFITPVNGKISSEFGLQRFYNKQPKLPHTGIDIANKTGTIIKSAAAGKVILIGNFFFNGNSVFIDHGKGLISAYLHMQKILVTNGQNIKRGDTIGTIGQTGRATGPHLHWSVYLNHTAINPKLLTH